VSLHISAIVALLFLSAFFSASETAFTSLSFVQIRMLEAKKGKVAHKAAHLASNRELLLSAILIGNNLANLSASALTTTFVISTWGNNLIGIGTGVLTLLILIFGEITPKQVAMSHNMTIAQVAAYPLQLFIWLLFPIIKAVRFVSGLITSLFEPKNQQALSLETLMHVVDAAEDEGIVDEYETNLVQRVLHFGEAPVKSVMTHRTEVFSIPDTMTLKEAFEPIVGSGFARVPVYHQSPENIVGILLVRDMLEAELRGRGDRPLVEFLHQPVFVPENRKLDDMLGQFQQQKLQMAVVLDEYGGLSGIVTTEDIVEQLFGEIYDEHESGTVQRIKALSDTSYIIKADTTMQQVKDDLDLEIEAADLTRTLAAFLIEQLGEIPSEGKTVEFPFGLFSIASMKGKKIESVRLNLYSPSH